MCNAQPLLCSAIAVEWFQTQQSNRTASAGLVQGQDRSRPGMSGSTRFTGSWSGSDLGGRKRSRAPNEPSRFEFRNRFQRAVAPCRRLTGIYPQFPMPPHHDFVRSSSSAPVTHEAKPIDPSPRAPAANPKPKQVNQLRTSGTTPRGVAMATLCARPADCFAARAFFEAPLRPMQQRKSQATAPRPAPGPARGRACNANGRPRRRRSPPAAMENVVILKRGEQVPPVFTEASTVETKVHASVEAAKQSSAEARGEGRAGGCGCRRPPRRRCHDSRGRGGRRATATDDPPTGGGGGRAGTLVSRDGSAGSVRGRVVPRGRARSTCAAHPGALTESPRQGRSASDPCA